MTKFDWQWTLGQAEHGPRAMFIWRDGHYYSDSLICSGIIPLELGGKPCPYSEGGRMPKPQLINPEQESATPLRGKTGELCPPCMARHYGDLQGWSARGERPMPEELMPLRVFRCHQFFWLVVPGLNDAEPAKLKFPEALPAENALPTQGQLFAEDDVPLADEGLEVNTETILGDVPPMDEELVVNDEAATEILPTVDDTMDDDAASDSIKS